MLFEQIAGLCNALSLAQKPKKLELLAKFFHNWRNKPENASLFAVLRLLVPQLDRDRSAYGIKENTLAKIYIRVLCLPSDGNDALKLMNYRAPKTAGSHAGDFADVAYWILKRRCGTGGELSLDEVNSALDGIALKHAEHDPRGVDAELTGLLQATSAEEQKWLIRMILKDMKFGIGHSNILDLFHPDARDLYDVTNSLSKVCETLKDPSVRLNEIEIKLFDPFRPMLSEELDVRKVASHFNQSPYFFVETKMDGERFQIHMVDGKFKYFSRRAHEYTANYGVDATAGTLTPKLSKLISPDVKSVILDGEMMCWSPKIEAFTTKGMEIDVKKLNETHLHRPCFCPFDVLFLNGEVLTNKPLINRLETLERILTPKQGVVSFVPRQRISKKEEVWDALNKAIDDCEEGIIMKQFLSVYKPNVRKNGGWYKIKPEYTDGLMDTVDLVIIGGYHGEGRYRGGISHFLLAVSVEGSFWSAARVGCGYSMAELTELQQRLLPYWQPYQRGVMPEGVEWTKEKPDVWIEPSKSVILEIKASEIVPSDMYRTGHTLRFARVQKVRYDKAWTDCATFAEFEQKRLNASGKLTSNRFSEGDMIVPTKIRKTRPQLEIAGHFKGADTTSVEVVSQLLHGKEICVMSGFAQFSREDLEKRIVRFGGSIVQNPGIGTWCVLCDEETLRVKNVMASGRHDVVRCSWLVPLLSRQTNEIPPVPRHGYHSLSLRTAAVLMRHYDYFGDHFTVPATAESLKLCMAAAAKCNLPKLTDGEKTELDVELFAGANPHRLFRRLVAFSPSSLELHLVLFDFAFNGGLRADCPDDSLTHAICQKGSEFVEELKELRRSRERKFHIVSAEWVSASIAAGVVLSERNFPP